jgi:hypothetical protein
MNYPKEFEFFEKRSFEVVHAVFRVAAVVARPTVREMLEERALEYFDIKDAISLEALREGVDLGAKIGEITEINAQVLLREIDALMKIARGFEEEDEKILSTMGEKGNNVSLEGLFSNTPVSFSDLADTDVFSDEQNPFSYDIVGVEGNGIFESPEMNLEKSGNAFNVSLNKNQEKPNQNRNESISGNSPEMKLEKSGNRVFQSFSKNRVSGKSGNESVQKSNTIPNSISTTAYSVPQAAERRELIISFLRNKTFCHVSDIVEQFPQVTDRTIRYDIKALVDNKIVERVGNGGPNSYFRLKRGSSQN